MYMWPSGGLHVLCALSDFSYKITIIIQRSVFLVAVDCQIKLCTCICIYKYILWDTSISNSYNNNDNDNSVSKMAKAL